MADEKKDEGSVTLLNQGQRSYDLGLDEKGKHRGVHKPGTAHVYTAAEAAKLAPYRELVDVAKLPGQLDARALKAENNKLKQENEQLRKQLLALPPAEVPAPEAEKSKVKK